MKRPSASGELTERNTALVSAHTACARAVRELALLPTGHSPGGDCSVGVRSYCTACSLVARARPQRSGRRAAARSRRRAPLALPTLAPKRHLLLALVFARDRPAGAAALLCVGDTLLQLSFAKPLVPGTKQRALPHLLPDLRAGCRCSEPLGEFRRF